MLGVGAEAVALILGTDRLADSDGRAEEPTIMRLCRLGSAFHLRHVSRALNDVELRVVAVLDREHPVSTQLGGLEELAYAGWRLLTVVLHCWTLDE